MLRSGRTNLASAFCSRPLFAADVCAILLPVVEGMHFPETDSSCEAITTLSDSGFKLSCNEEECHLEMIYLKKGVSDRNTRWNSKRQQTVQNLFNYMTNHKQKLE